MWKRHQKKSEDTIARIKNTETAIKHRDKKAEEWMKREPYGGITRNEQKGKNRAESNGSTSETNTKKTNT